MAKENRLDEYHQAISLAKEHRENAGELLIEHGQEQDEGKQQYLLEQAREETGKAEEFERHASEILENPEQVSPEQDQSLEGQEQSDPTYNSGKRTWYEPGTVADDVLLQLSEASEGSVIGNVLEYAARSVFDEDHRSFEGAKMLKDLAMAPVTAFKEAQSAARSFQSRGQGSSQEQTTGDRNPDDPTRQDQGPQDQGPQGQATDQRDPAINDDRAQSTVERDQRGPNPQQSDTRSREHQSREQEHEIEER